MAAPDKDEDVTVDLATTIILKPGNVNDQSVGYASGIAGEVVNGSMTLPNGITIVAFYLTGCTLTGIFAFSFVLRYTGTYGIIASLQVSTPPQNRAGKPHAALCRMLPFCLEQGACIGKGNL